MKRSGLKSLGSLGAMLCLAAGLTACAGNPTRESTGEYVDDSAITARVKTAMIGDKDVAARNISVETFKGTVQLSGFVDTTDEKDRAAALASNVRGVRSIQNDIKVK